MGYKEKKISNNIVLNCTENERLFRSNAGMGWIGKIIGKGIDWIKIKNPRPFHGLPEGFSDLFGLKSIVVTPDMIGKRVALFWAVEVKTKNIPTTDEQIKFGKMIRKLGGIFEIVRQD